MSKPTGALMFHDPEALERRIEDYFESLNRVRTIRQRGNDGNQIEFEEEYQMPPTMAGLALALGTTRVTLLHYSKGKGTRDERFIPIIARAKERIAEFAEQALYTREGSNGARFALDVNHRYGREVDNQGSAESFSVNVIPPASGEAIRAIPKWEDDDNDE